MARFERKETPPQQSDYRSYTPFLRKDFRFQCAYCERTEAYLGGAEAFEVDHFRPAQKFPSLVAAYNNLYYSCRKCNAHKHIAWPAEDRTDPEAVFADPCIEDPYEVHLRETLDGGLDELTACGTYTNGHIRLDRPALREWRHRRSQAKSHLPHLRAIEDDLVRYLDFANPQDIPMIEGKLEALRTRIRDTQSRFLIS